MIFRYQFLSIDYPGHKTIQLLKFDLWLPHTSICWRKPWVRGSINPLDLGTDTEEMELNGKSVLTDLNLGTREVVLYNHWKIGSHLSAKFEVTFPVQLLEIDLNDALIDSTFTSNGSCVNKKNCLSIAVTICQLKLFIRSTVRSSSQWGWPRLPQNCKKCDFVNVSVVINSFFLGYWHNVGHLIFASCYIRDTLYCSRHLNFAIFSISRNLRN